MVGGIPQCCHCRYWRFGGSVADQYNQPQSNQSGGAMIGECLRSMQQGSRHRSATPLTTQFDFACVEFTVNAPAASITGIANPFAPMVNANGSAIGGSIGAPLPIVLNGGMPAMLTRNPYEQY